MIEGIHTWIGRAIEWSKTRRRAPYLASLLTLMIAMHRYTWERLRRGYRRHRYLKA